ncbi:hypothetical protein SAMN04487991_0439 [Celeribacter neptunius]|uniref:Uncharacterized protein n=1 Tax=Celeribacter neptunius TaxID=588602 RepID=A0A1I3JS51_9RHOB|nr:hypothetical protein SAMN04487991_0439 [Celeribacter neptunius]
MASLRVREFLPPGGVAERPRGGSGAMRRDSIPGAISGAAVRFQAGPPEWAGAACARSPAFQQGKSGRLALSSVFESP